jgi:hypothetical protein
MSQEAAAALEAFKVPPASTPAAGEVAWTRFKELVDRHGSCDDGSHGEFFSDLTVRTLITHWSAALKFAPLINDPGFRGFVWQHIDASATTKDLLSLRRKALTRCKERGAAGLCQSISKLCDEALAEQRP